MKRSLALAAAALAAVTLVAAGCGGSDEVPADAVAVVDGTSITRSSLDGLLARAKKSYTAQKRDFPKAGTSDYQTLQTQAVAYLVQREEYATEADDLGIKVTDDEIAKKVDEVKKQYFENDPKKFEAGLKQQGYTEEALREDLHSQLVSEKIYENLTNSVKVSDAELQKYYDDHKDEFQKPKKVRLWSARHERDRKDFRPRSRSASPPQDRGADAGRDGRSNHAPPEGTRRACGSARARAGGPPGG